MKVSWLADLDKWSNLKETRTKHNLQIESGVVKVSWKFERFRRTDVAVEDDFW